MVKFYFEGFGTTGGDILTISYSANGTEYSVTIANGYLLAAEDMKDNGLRDSLENSKHTIENEKIKDNECVFYNYKFEGFNPSIYDEFFK